MEFRNIKTDVLPDKLEQDFDIPKKMTFEAVEDVRSSNALAQKSLLNLEPSEVVLVSDDGTEVSLSEPSRDRWTLKVTSAKS